MITLKDLQKYDSVYEAIQFAQNTNIAYPTRVNKPVLKDSSNLEQLVAHVEALKQYEIEKAEYDVELQAYNNVKNATDNIIEEYIKEESGLNNIPIQYRDKVYYKAWQDSHSDGFYSVYQNLEELIDIFN